MLCREWTKKEGKRHEIETIFESVKREKDFLVAEKKFRLAFHLHEITFFVVRS